MRTRTGARRSLAGWSEHDRPVRSRAGAGVYPLAKVSTAADATAPGTRTRSSPSACCSEAAGTILVDTTNALPIASRPPAGGIATAAAGRKELRPRWVAMALLGLL